MRIAELSRRSGVTVPTIKYYLRERLLPPGKPTGRNQADYSDQHLERLRLVRALREVGGLTVAAAAEVLSSLDSPPESRHELRGLAHRAVIPPPSRAAADPTWQHAREQARTWVNGLGWRVELEGPAVDRLADVFATLHELGEDNLLACLPSYAEAATTVAAAELAATAHRPDSAAAMTSVVTGTVLGERLLAAVRLLAQEHISAGYHAPAEPSPPC